MGVVDAFTSTWSAARQTFGEGVPEAGQQFDNSGTFRRMQGDVGSADPGSQWTGTASSAYGKANQDHSRVLGQLAGLDQRLAAEIDRSAQVVTTGRRELDAVHKWVIDAASRVPQNATGERMLIPVVSKGLTDLTDIVQRSNTQLNSIGETIRGISGEYQLLGNQKIGGSGGPPLGTGPDDKGEEERRRQAEQDVRDALAGDKDAATRVNRVLDGIVPGTPLTAEQGSCLSQLQAQQHGLSVQDLKDAQQRLGDQGRMIGNSWQLMSNPNVHFPKTELKPGALDNPAVVQNGAKTLLPDSVQRALNRDILNSFGAKVDPLGTRADNAHDVSTIADIARQGNPALQQGTEFDDALLDWSREALHDQTKPGLWDGLGLGSGYEQYADARDDAIADVFNTAGRDHSSVSAELAGDTGQQFLTDLHTHVWADAGDATQNRQSTHTLLDWIADEAHSPNDQVAARAGAAAHALAVNLDANHDRYLNPEPFLGATPNVANLNPELISADAIALAPYQDALVGDLSGTKGFAPIGDPGSGDLKAARNVFAVIDSDPGAAKMFNAAAEQKILAHQQAFADAAAAGPPSQDTPRGDLKSAAYLLGAVNGGAEQEAVARGLQGAQTEQAIYDIKKAGLDYLFGKIPGTSEVPGFDITRDAIETGILGKDPEEKPAQPNVPVNSAQSAVNMTYYQIANALAVGPGDADIPAQFFTNGHLKSPDQISAEGGDLRAYSTALQNYLFHHGFGDIGSAYRDFYSDGAGKS